MARLERPTKASSNPAQKFLHWKSNKKCFSYWNKETEQEVDIELPFKFLFLEHYHTVKGWHGATDKGIVSNEVYALGSEPLNVRTFAGIDISKGLYKDIKDTVKAAGGVYFRSVYVMLEDGTLANLQLKGAAVGGLKKEQAVKKIEVQGYSDFYNDNKHLLDNQWIEVNGAADGKKGATSYAVPVFSLGQPIGTDADAMATKCANVLQEYINGYKNAKPIADIEVDVEDDLEF